MKKKLEDRNIHIGPSDYVPWLNDNKVAFIRMEGRLFGDMPMNLELRLSVEVRTGKRLDEEGEFHQLTHDEWMARRSELESQGGFSDAR